MNHSMLSATASTLDARASASHRLLSSASVARPSSVPANTALHLINVRPALSPSERIIEYRLSRPATVILSTPLVR
jgi:hypothetical protein